jgi:hypothetical protein
MPDARSTKLVSLSPRVIAALLIAVWCIVEWTLLRQATIAGDWVGWREAECMLYPAFIALFLRVFGDVEWPGQLISLMAIAGAAWVLFGTLGRLYPDARGRPALVGLVAFLITPVVAFVGSSVQPEATCLFLFVVAWSYFLRYEAEGQLRHVVLFAIFGALAMLVKPTAAQLGVASFVVLAVRPASRKYFKRPHIWLAWVFMVAVLGLFMWHAHSLFERYHNTFGVLSGGDSKLPKLRQLKMLGTYKNAGITVGLYGFGILGLCAFAGALLRKKVDAPTWGLLVANGVWTFIAIRYVSNLHWGGLHYTIVSAVLAGHAAALVTPLEADAERVRRITFATGAVAAVAAVLFTFVGRRRARIPNEEAEQVLAAGQKLGELSGPTDLVIVRSAKYAVDHFWNTPNNFEDPRVFYTAKRRGWVLGRDQVDTELLEDRARRGARYYIEPGPDFIDQPIDPWLATHADLAGTTPLGGRIFRLRFR